MFRIKFNTKKTPEQINSLLAEKKITNRVLSDKDLQDWVDEINAPNSKQKHLIPENSVMTVELLQKTFSSWAETYLFETDLYFGRTPDEELVAIAEFVNEHKDLISYVKGSKLLIERGNIKKNLLAVLNKLEVVEEEPKKLPKEKQTDDSLQSGLMLCKSWSINPFWVAFGNVEKPTFMKKRIYENDSYNNLYKTKEGYAVMLLPLLELGKVNQFEDFMTQAWELGLREHPAYFNTYVYGAHYMVNSDLVTSVAEFYTKEELEERLGFIREMIISHNYHYKDGAILEKNGCKYVEGTKYNHLYQSSKEKKVWDILANALANKNLVEA